MKKDIEYYMSLPYTIKIEQIKDDDGMYFFAKIEELVGCHSDGATAVEAVSALEEVKRDYLEVKLEMGADIPEPDDLPSGKILARLPRTLHKNLIIEAAQENVSLNQLVVYKLSK